MSTRRYVQDLLRGKRPRGFKPNAAEAAELRAAITLAAARPEAAEPRAEFVHELHRKLAAQANPAAPPPDERPIAEPIPLRLGPTRRRVLVAGGIAAGAAAIGAVGDHLISSEPERNNEAAAGASTLEPNVGTWQTVAETSDIAVGGVHRFDLGSVVGFVSRDAGGLRAVSGICTHQGCRLNLDPGNRELDCPCHNTSFAVDGTLVRHQLYTPPPPLPHLQVREQDGRIEVYVPV